MNDEVIILRHQNAALHLLRYGATIHRFIVNGRDLVAGPENHEDYRKSRTFQNVIIGRYSSVSTFPAIGNVLGPNSQLLLAPSFGPYPVSEWDRPKIAAK